MKSFTIEAWTITGNGLNQPITTGSTFDIMSLLVEEGVLDHPYVEDWEVRAQWVGQQDWVAQGVFYWPLLPASENQSPLPLDTQEFVADSPEQMDSKSTSNQVWLALPHIDTITDMYVNQHYLGSTTSAFYAQKYELSAYLISGENTITIIFRSPEAKSLEEANKRSKSYPFGVYPLQSPHRNMIRKPQCHGGWDWGPCLMTSGILEPLVILPPSKYLLTDGQVLVFPPQLTSKSNMQSDSQVQATDGSNSQEFWTLQISCILEGFHPQEYQFIEHFCQRPGSKFIQAKVLDNNGVVVGQTQGALLDFFEFEGEKPRCQLEIQVKKPNLWWPNGMGEQHLYNLELNLPEGFVADFPLTHSIGFRDLQLVTEPDEHGTSFYFQVNGKAFFAKGANWIPADALPMHAGPGRITSLLTSARDANMNMIRVWGGGQYESTHFYEECSRLGLLVWQDFMFACGTYPGDQDFLQEVKKEVSYQVRRLSGIPSLALWCGNNENLLGLQWYVPDSTQRESYLVDYDRLYEGTIGNIVRTLDPTRRYWPSSPSAGSDTYGKDHDVPHQGDMHYWKVWHHGLPLEGYLDVIPRFCSEFGFQSFTSPEGISRTIESVYASPFHTNQANQKSSSEFVEFPNQKTKGSWASDQDWHLSGKSLDYHQKNPRGNAIIMENILRSYPLRSSTEQLIYTSQVLQARAFETAVDFWRSHAPRSMGSLYWQLNDLWPVASWSSLEYPDKWKLTHYKAQEFFQPLRIALIQHPRKIPIGQYAPRVFDIEPVVLSDVQRDVSMTLRLELISFRGERKEILNKKIDLARKFTQSLGRFCPEDFDIDPKDWFIYGQLFPGDATHVTQVVSEGARFFVPEKSARIQKPNLNLEWNSREETKEMYVTFSTDVPTFGLFLDTPGILGRWKQNGLTLLPGESKTLEFLVRDIVRNPWSSGLIAKRDQLLLQWFKQADPREVFLKIQELTWRYCLNY